jgi:hypothetical protein
MLGQQWLDDLAKELRRRGIPETRRQRLLAELRDHWIDLAEENEMSTMQTGMSERMGMPAHLADLAKHEYRKAGLIARYPAVAFLVLPLPTAVLSVVACTLLLSGLAWITGFLTALENRQPDLPLSASSQFLLDAFCVTIRFAPFVVAAGLFAWLSRRAGVSGWWCLASCVLVGVLAGAFNCQLQIPVDGGKGALSMGLGFPWSGPQYVQLAVPLIFGLAAWYLLPSRVLARR